MASDPDVVAPFESGHLMKFKCISGMPLRLLQTPSDYQAQSNVATEEQEVVVREFIAIVERLSEVKEAPAIEITNQGKTFQIAYGILMGLQCNILSITGGREGEFWKELQQWFSDHDVDVLKKCIADYITFIALETNAKKQTEAHQKERRDQLQKMEDITMAMNDNLNDPVITWLKTQISRRNYTAQNKHFNTNNEDEQNEFWREAKAQLDNYKSNSNRSEPIKLIEKSFKSGSPAVQQSWRSIISLSYEILTSSEGFRCWSGSKSVVNDVSFLEHIVKSQESVENFEEFLEECNKQSVCRARYFALLAACLMNRNFACKKIRKLVDVVMNKDYGLRGDTVVKSNGCTLLMQTSSHLSMLEALLKEKANAGVPLRDRNGDTALHYVLSSADSGDSVQKHVLQLWKSGADENEVDSGQKTLLMAAASSGVLDTLDILLNMGADTGVHLQDPSGRTALHYAIMSAVNFRINWQDQSKEQRRESRNERRVEHIAKVQSWHDNLQTTYEKTGDKESEKIIHDLTGRRVAPANPDTEFHNLTVTRKMYKEVKEAKIAKMCEKLLEIESEEPIIDIVDGRGRTPLMLAAEQDLLEVFKLLTARGNAKKKKSSKTSSIRACVKFPADTCGHTVLFYAIMSVHETTTTSVSDCTHRLLNSSNADQIDWNLTNKDGDTVLHFAVRENLEKVVDAILQQEFTNIDINLQNNNGKNVLHVACSEGGTKVVNALILHSLEIEMAATDKNGYNALHHAAGNSDQKVCKAILESEDVDINAVENKGNTALHLASIHDNEKVVDILLEAGVAANTLNKDGKSPLHVAAENNKVGAVESLLRHEKININQQSEDGDTALYLAAENNHPQVFKLLILVGRAKKIDVNLKNLYCCPPIHRAVYQGHDPEMLRGLLHHPDIDPNPQDDDGLSALHWAAQNENADVCKMLLQHPNINVNLQDLEMETPLHKVARYRTDNKPASVQVARALLAMDSIDLTLRDKYDFTVLHTSAARGNTPEIFKLLLAENSIDINYQTERAGEAEGGDTEIFYKGDTPLHCAVQNRFRDPDFAIALLSRKDLNVNLKNDAGNTALHTLMSHETRENAKQQYESEMLIKAVHVTRALLERKDIDINLLNKQGEAAIDIARSNGYAEVVNVLEAHK